MSCLIVLQCGFDRARRFPDADTMLRWCCCYCFRFASSRFDPSGCALFLRYFFHIFKLIIIFRRKSSRALSLNHFRAHGELMRFRTILLFKLVDFSFD